MSDAETVAYLRTARAVRDRAELALARGLAGDLRWFDVDLGRMGEVIERVAGVTRRAYPDLDVPFHSRWRHFDAGGVDRLAALGELDPRARFDLAVTSVLLDAGAGAMWRYRGEDGKVYARSEGLAVASFEMFAAGAFSGDPEREPHRADADGLEQITVDTLCDRFQVGQDNVLVGVDARAALLRRLAVALRAAPALFGRRARIGGLYDYLRSRAVAGVLAATEILSAVLEGLGPIWPGRVEIDGENLGDVWRHSELGLVPFHKLSQWLTYSLIEPLEDAGVTVTGLEELTGLAEYRNGGLFVDTGVLVPREAAVTTRRHAPGDDVVIEWRALTVALLDRTASGVRDALGVDAAALPLAAVLEGGTWRAGREIAGEKRTGGAPPIHIDSDGTVF